MSNELVVVPQTGNEVKGEMKVRFAPYTLRQLITMRKEGRLRFDLAIQRNSVWKKEQKAKLIDSVLHGFPIPPIFAHQSEDDLMWMIDGKQRNTAWLEFFEDMVAILKGAKPVRVRKQDGSGEVEYINIEGKFFKDLPEVLQNRFLDREIIMMEVSNATNEEIEEMFQRLNGGSSLTKMELTRAKSGHVIEFVNELAKLPFFKEYAFISEASRNRFIDQEMILQILMLIDGRESGISSGEIETFTMALKANGGVDEATRKIVNGTAAYLYDAFTPMVQWKDGKPDHKVLNKMLKKIHIPMLFLTAIESIQREVDPVAFGEWARDFLIERYTPGSGPYGSRCVAGSAKKENVKGRTAAMKNDFFKNIDKIVEKVAAKQSQLLAQQQSAAAKAAEEAKAQEEADRLEAENKALKEQQDAEAQAEQERLAKEEADRLEAARLEEEARLAEDEASAGKEDGKEDGDKNPTE